MVEGAHKRSQIQFLASRPQISNAISKTETAETKTCNTISSLLLLRGKYTRRRGIPNKGISQRVSFE